MYCRLKETCGKSRPVYPGCQRLFFFASEASEQRGEAASTRREPAKRLIISPTIRQRASATRVRPVWKALELLFLCKAHLIKIITNLFHVTYQFFRIFNKIINILAASFIARKRFDLGTTETAISDNIKSVTAFHIENVIVHTLRQTQ